MKIKLFPFQNTALDNLMKQLGLASMDYRVAQMPQIISYTAPTGAGKTIIMSALIEAVYHGYNDATGNLYTEQSDAIFVWLSDSPHLNEQSRLKIETKTDRCFSRCVTITDDSFDQETLDDGKIYFLNTSKLGKMKNLTKHSDTRQYTIWETLAKTVADKADRLYFIIDEAHRGSQKSSDLVKATTIMQKFLKGSQEDGIPPMPIVIGMTATPERFNRLAENISSTTRKVVTTVEDVRISGLLKDRIVVVYPESSGKDMAVLQAAVDEWLDKCIHWKQFCQEQHHRDISPVLIVQVENAKDGKQSATDLDECVRTIENRIGKRFTNEQVVHCFGDVKSDILMNGIQVPYVEPSQISDDRRIQIVFFKEALSTGWDCPRAETMMSFRRAVDSTYIAQLLGRMIRTPAQQRIIVDSSLNEVKVYLPYFDKDTVNNVVEAVTCSPAYASLRAFLPRRQFSLSLKSVLGQYQRAIPVCPTVLNL